MLSAAALKHELNYEHRARENMTFIVMGLCEDWFKLAVVIFYSLINVQIDRAQLYCNVEWL